MILLNIISINDIIIYRIFKIAVNNFANFPISKINTRKFIRTKDVHLLLYNKKGRENC